MLKNDLSQYQADKHLLASAVILIDTREQENKHIIDWLDKKNIKHESRKLPYGDYGIKLPKNAEFGIVTDQICDFTIEKKNSLEEISGNLAEETDRFENELKLASGRMAVVIENASYDKVIRHEYKTQYNEKAFLARLLTLQHRYNVPIHFITKENAPQLIYGILYYKLREELK